MTTTNNISSLLQSYYQSKIGSIPAALQAQTASPATTTSTSKVDSATFSDEAMQALLAAEFPSATTDATDPLASVMDSLTSSISGTTPMTTQQKIQQAQLNMLQSEQSLLDTSGTGSSNTTSGQTDDLTSLLMLNDQALNQQYNKAIQAAQERMLQTGSIVNPALDH